MPLQRSTASRFAAGRIAQACSIPNLSQRKVFPQFTPSAFFPVTHRYPFHGADYALARPRIRYPTSNVRAGTRRKNMKTNASRFFAKYGSQRSPRPNNIKGSTTNERRCFEVFTMVFDLHLKQDAHWLASHFIPRLPLDTSTFANQGNEGKKRKATMETEREGGGGERTVSKDCKVLGSNDSNESMESNPGALRVREWRHKLQKTFLPSSAVLPKEDDMPAIDTLFKVLEIYGGMNVEYLNFSKIGKIMRHINLLPPNRVPRDDEFHFRDRAGALVNKWHKLLNSNSNSTDAAETEVTVKAESATEHTARMDVDGPGTGGADDSGSDLEWDVVNSSNKRMRRE
ncbi:hypothetical protein K438DRAFT_1039605 [Mycena galopus ATCC 62051]|nr:hypothetical protein K438DRAFT_1039605 [Mycena galopus ATCC 62051]